MLKDPATEVMPVKSDEEIMEILEAFDLTRSDAQACVLLGGGPRPGTRTSSTSLP